MCNSGDARARKIAAVSSIPGSVSMMTRFVVTSACSISLEVALHLSVLDDLGVCNASRLLSARICRLTSQEPIEREGSSTAREEKEEDGAPGEMVGPGVGIHKCLDHSQHPQERQGGQACGQTKHEQDRTPELDRHRQHR